MDEVAWSTVLAMAERLKWQSSFPAGQETVGLAVGERALDQLQDFIMLQDVLDLLQCICDATSRTADNIDGQPIMPEPAGWYPSDPYQDFPTEAGGGDPLYGESTWAAALDKKCQLAQLWVDRVGASLVYVNDNFQPFNDFFNKAWLWQVVEKIITDSSGFVRPAMELFFKALGATVGTLASLGDAIDQLADRKEDIVCEIYQSPNPWVAAGALINGPFDEFGAAFTPLGGRLILATALRVVWTGEAPGPVVGDLVAVDASSYSNTYCDNCGQPPLPEITWTTCTGATTSQMLWNTNVSFSTVSVASDRIYMITFWTPVTLTELHSNGGGPFNFRYNVSNPNCGLETWTGQQSINEVMTTFPPVQIKGIQVWRSGTANWTGGFTVSP